MSKLSQFFFRLVRPAEPEAPRPGEVEAVKLPVLQMLFSPFSLFVDSPLRFLAVAGFVGLIMTVISIASGQGYLCLFTDYALSHYCTNNPLVYAVIRLANLFLIALFMVKWYQSVFMRRPLSLHRLTSVGKPTLKVFTAQLIFIVLSMISLLSGYLLYARVPNPDWRIELAYFTVVSIGFLVPFVLIRFYGVFGFLMAGEALPPLRRFWEKTRGNSLLLLGSVGLIFFVSLIFLMAFLSHFRLAASSNAFYIGFVVEFLYNLLLLLLACFFANHCYLQQIYLFGRKDDGQ